MATTMAVRLTAGFITGRGFPSCRPRLDSVATDRNDTAQRVRTSGRRRGVDDDSASVAIRTTARCAVPDLVGRSLRAPDRARGGADRVGRRTHGALHQPPVPHARVPGEED